ncbi:5'/3'-nucleotidase SurE [bacterium]|nr:5'/3'-nucleotidase SurE [bacterium]
MRILVSNDDGIHAPGIRAMALALATEHEVTVVAPDRERSATGHALTLHKPLRVEKHDLGGKIKAAYSVNGTPSDCVKLAVGPLLDELPDVVFSGINRGPNLGTDVIYSGTVSAALEATIRGVQGVAMSLATFSDIGYEEAAQFALVLARTLESHRLPHKVLLNVNYPALTDTPAQEVRITRLGERKYTDLFETRIDPRGKDYYWLAGEVIEVEEDPDTDVSAIRDNCISVTPIHYDMTCKPMIPEVQGWHIPTTLAGFAAASKQD